MHSISTGEDLDNVYYLVNLNTITAIGGSMRPFAKHIVFIKIKLTTKVSS
jgi:hypothetical protein